MGEQMTNAEIEIVLKDMAALVAKTAETTANLEEKTIPQPDVFGNPDLSGKRETVRELRQDALKLRESLGISQSQ
jgi:hypothetical protein